MSSTTRSTFSPLSTTSSVSPLKRKAMSVTQTYYLAHTARAKLSHEAARSDHNLRLLVGHANLLDSLMLELAEAEQEQESWFNQSVRKASRTEEPRHIQWADAVEDPEEDWQAEDADDSSDSESEYDSEDEDMETGFAPLQRVQSRSAVAPQFQFSTIEEEDEEEEEFEEDEEEDLAVLTLQRTKSHSNSPMQLPALDHDSDDSSEDESMPPSPPNNALPSFSEKSQFYSQTESASSMSSFEDNFFLPQRTQPSLITAISVY